MARVHAGCRMLLAFLLLFVLLGPIADGTVDGEASNTTVASGLTTNEISSIESWVDEQMQAGRIPGASVVIVKGRDTIYQKGFGYADVDKKQAVSTQDLFELGSASKAFTGLAILKLEEEGRLQLDDPVTTYIPWLHMTYSGEYGGERITRDSQVTVGQLMHQTSGIPFKTIGDIPATQSDTALEQTIRTLSGEQLDSFPGERFQYATINYDVLGYIIQQVSGMSYETYIKDHVLEPLGLKHTYVSAEGIGAHALAKGYKIGYLKAREYEAPVFRGNTPAGYIYTNSDDMANWLKIQLNAQPAGGALGKALTRSHMPDRSVPPGPDGSSYAAGWFVYQSGGGELSHGGSNPTYSASVLFRPEEQLGVAVLANLNSTNTQIMGQGIMDILQQKKPISDSSDIYRSVDRVSVVILCIAIPFIAVTLWFFLTSCLQLVRKERKLRPNRSANAIRVLSFLVFAGLLSACFYQIPEILFNGVSWHFVEVWAPSSFMFSIITLLVGLVLFTGYLTFNALFPGSDRRNFFPMLVLSMISGLGNALVIFIINEALNRTSTFQAGLLSFFVLGIIIYAFSQRIVRAQLITLTNNMVYQKRTEIIDKILDSSYQNIENIENEKLYSVLNNDTETISGVINVLIFGLTSLVTLICCFIYLGIINMYGLLISIAVIATAAGLYFVTGRYANKLWEETRDIQNTFFKFIGHMAGGFKELSIHDGKKQAFRQDIGQSCDTYRTKRIQGDLSFANVFVIGELLFTFVIGVVAFIFPIVFDDIQSSSLRGYIFVFLYMAAPVRGVLDAIPNFIRVRISWNRLMKLSEELKTGHQDAQLNKESHTAIAPELPVEIELRQVEYSYKNEDGEQFTVGPVDLTLRAGEITFITGGNGSGKSTLVKLITGLYKPDHGEILLNGLPITPAQLGQHFTAVFSDYHLFDKLYGIEEGYQETRILDYLKTLEIEDKVQINEGVFSTTKLSSGQRRRLALLITYIEDRPVYLFDEWAADQDPEFRNFFYHSVLPDFRRRGKCVVAVTHDDRFFDIADTLLKMELGKIAQIHQGHLSPQSG